MWDRGTRLNLVNPTHFFSVYSHRVESLLCNKGENDRISRVTACGETFIWTVSSPCRHKVCSQVFNCEVDCQVSLFMTKCDFSSILRLEFASLVWAVNSQDCVHSERLILNSLLELIMPNVKGRAQPAMKSRFRSRVFGSPSNVSRSRFLQW